MYCVRSNLLLAHVIEETSEAKNGVEFLTTTREDWTGISFEGHIIWHLTLYYLGKYNVVLMIYNGPCCHQIWEIWSLFSMSLITNLLNQQQLKTHLA